MRAVFDHSWELLNEEERTVFKRLSVFRGGFRRKAAEQVAKATLPILTALVDKSLLRWDPDGRYQIHELLRQYAAEHLVLSPDDIAQVYDRHCAYYADFLYRRAEGITSSRQLEVIQEVAAELENVRAAWAWAVQQGDVANIQKATIFYQFCDSQGRFQEGTDALEKAMVSLESAEPSSQRDLTLAAVLVYLGWLYIRLGRLEKARDTLERSQIIFNDLGVPPSPGLGTDPLTGLGVLANTLGNYAEAERLAEEARQLGQARADKQNLQIAFYILANAASAQGQYEAGRRYAQQAYDLTQETDNYWFMAYVLSDLGNIARALGDYAQARQYYQASYAIKQEFNDPEGTAVALNHLGKVAWLQQSYQEAENLYQQSLAIYQEINDQGGLATSLNGLGATAYALGHYQGAQQYFQQALQITTKMQFVPLTLSILNGLAELLGQTGQPEQAVELLALVLHHPASDYETKARAQQLLARYKQEFPPELFAAAIERGQASSLETGVATLQTNLAASSQDEGTQSRLKAKTKNTAFHLSSLNPQPLVEPLTPRELEVLGLIAEGLTNQQIAGALVISVGTAKFYTSQIYSKLNVSSRTQAVARAREINLLSWLTISIFLLQPLLATGFSPVL
jgi:ATP/maltotriose-dependent transcriptional regulator MalT